MARNVGKVAEDPGLKILVVGSAKREDETLLESIVSSLDDDFKVSALVAGQKAVSMGVDGAIRSVCERRGLGFETLPQPVASRAGHDSDSRTLEDSKFFASLDVSKVSRRAMAKEPLVAMLRERIKASGANVVVLMPNNEEVLGGSAQLYRFVAEGLGMSVIDASELAAAFKARARASSSPSPGM